MNLDLNSLWFFILVVKQDLELHLGVIHQSALWILSETPWESAQGGQQGAEGQAGLVAVTPTSGVVSASHTHEHC